MTREIDPLVLRTKEDGGNDPPSPHVEPPTGAPLKDLVPTLPSGFVLEGIRGSGKTHTLRAIELKTRREYGESGILSLRVALSELLGSREDAGILVDLLSLSVIDSGISAVTELLTTSKPQKENHNDGSIKARSKLGEWPINTDLAGRGAQARKLIESPLLRPQTAFSGEVGPSQGVNLQRRPPTSETLRRRNSVEKAVEYLLEIRKHLDAKYVYLLIDQIEDSPAESQAEVFNFLRMAGAIAGRMKLPLGFALGAYPAGRVLGTKYPSARQGASFNWDPHQDAQCVHLKVPIQDPSYRNFFLQILDRRLQAFCKDGTKDYHDLCADSESIEFATYAAGGLPSRFFAILRAAYGRIRPLPDLPNKVLWGDSIGLAIDEVQEAILADSRLGPSVHRDEVFEPGIPQSWKYFDEILAQMRQWRESGPPERRSSLFFGIRDDFLPDVEGLLQTGAVHSVNWSIPRQKGYSLHVLMIDLGIAYAYDFFPRGRSLSSVAAASEAFTRHVLPTLLGHVEPHVLMFKAPGEGEDIPSGIDSLVEDVRASSARFPLLDVLKRIEREKGELLGRLRWHSDPDDKVIRNRIRQLDELYQRAQEKLKRVGSEVKGGDRNKNRGP